MVNEYLKSYCKYSYRFQVVHTVLPVLLLNKVFVIFFTFNG